MAPEALYAQGTTTDADTTEPEVKVKKKDLAGHQLMVGVDIYRPILNSFLKDRTAYELSVNYYTRNEYYLTAEGGFGGSNVKYPDLKYTTSNSFLRLGFNRSILVRDKPEDWDMMFIGFGAGYANISRSDAAYVVTDSVWGSASEVHSGGIFKTYWAEVTGGVRVEFAPHLFAGWNVRGKFMMNGRTFKDLAPIYIAGYGKGDKNSSFDVNMYISYAIRWKRKTITPTDTTPVIPAPASTADSTNKVLMRK